MARPRTTGAARAAARRTATARSTASSAACGCPRAPAWSRGSAQPGAGGWAGTPATGSGRRCSRSSSRSSARRRLGRLARRRLELGERHARRDRSRPVDERHRPDRARADHDRADDGHHADRHDRRRRLPRPRSRRSPRGRPPRAAGRSCSTRCRRTNGRAGAVGEAKQALRLGLKPVGVLDSAGFSSLHPGYYVVFFGIYGSEAEAQSHVIEAHRRGYREPYPRRITR